jgi:hypothetical protein
MPKLNREGEVCIASSVFISVRRKRVSTVGRSLKFQPVLYRGNFVISTATVGPKLELPSWTVLRRCASKFDDRYRPLP